MDIQPIFKALMRNKAGMALIVVQIAITLAVVCNSLFIILDRSQRVGRPSGIDEVDTFTISSIGFVKGYDTAAAVRQDLDLIRSHPGVVAATVTNTTPLSNGGWSTGFDVQPLDSSGTRRAQSTALYFGDEQSVAAFGATLVAGRAFTPEEITDFSFEDGLHVKSVIVTQALANALYPDGDALGKIVYGPSGDTETATIVGIVDRLQQPWPGSRFVEQSAFLPVRFFDRNGGFSRYFVRTAPGQRDAVMKEIEAKLQAANTGRILREARTLESVRDNAYRQDRAMMAILIGVMVGLMVVTGLGIVGLASFWVTRRIKQIGTRRALGARRFDVRSYFQTENGIMVGMGVGLGLVLTYGFNLWLMQHYDAPRLPWYYLPLGAAAVFVLGQIAVLGPARRAAQISPAIATRAA